MSVTIRLAKVGKRNAPAYKIVVANTRDKRNGKFLDILGYYNPSMNPVQYSLDSDKYSEWINNGAMVSKAVADLKENKYEYKKYAGHKGAVEAIPQAEAAAEEVTEVETP